MRFRTRSWIAFGLLATGIAAAVVALSLRTHWDQAAPCAGTSAVSDARCATQKRAALENVGIRTSSAAPLDASAVVKLVRRLARAIARTGATARDVAEVVGDDITDDGAPDGLRVRADVRGVKAVIVTRRWGGEDPNAAEISLAPGLRLTDLETRIGPSRRLPSRKPGDRRVIFDDQDDAATTIASIRKNGGVRSITVRREH